MKRNFRNVFLALGLLAISQHAELAIAQVANGKVTTGAPTYVNGNTAPLSLDTSGNLRTSGAATVTGTVSLGAGTANVGVTGVAQGTALGSVFGNLGQGSVTTAAPSYTTGQIRPFSIDTNGNMRVIDASSIPAGANSIGTVGLNAGTNTIGNINVAARTVTASAMTSLTTAASVMVATPVSVVGFTAANFATGSEAVVYDNASACSGTVRFRVLLTLTNESANVYFPTPLTFSNGVTVCKGAGTGVMAISYF